MIAVKMKVLKMRKAVLGLAVLWVFGFVVSGCDNGTTDIGTAPTLTRVYAGTSSDSGVTMTETSTISKGSNTNVYVGLETNDPDADITKVFYRIMLDSVKVYPTDKDFDEINLPNALPASYTGVLFAFPISAATVASGYTFEVYVVDAKGNKSETKTSNTFEITD
jgi:hypothetical protein